MSAFAIELGGALPLSLTLGDGASSLFPQANVYDSAEVEVAGSPFDLVEVGITGRYSSALFTPLVADTFVARYVVYSDAGHTTELLRYERSEDGYVVIANLLALANGVELGITLRDWLRSVGALLLGVSTGGPTKVEADAIGNPGTPRVDATSDSNGNHTTVILTP